MDLIQPREALSRERAPTISPIRPMEALLGGELVWAAIPPSDTEPERVFMGIGCTSEFGLPFDVLAMLLACKDTGLAKDGSEATILIADWHASLSSCSMMEARARAFRWAADLARVAAAARLPTNIVFAYELRERLEYRFVARAVAAQANAQLATPYNLQSIVDAVYMTMTGHLKVGWSRYPQNKLKEGKGRSDEFNGTDRLAKEILPGFCALYVPHGETTDSTRPTGVPYSVHAEGVAARLMLTGDERGNFHQKLAAATPRRRKAVVSHVSRIVNAWERINSPVPGDDVVSKAVSIVEVINGA
jgi:hypothetical protein